MKRLPNLPDVAILIIIIAVFANLFSEVQMPERAPVAALPTTTRTPTATRTPAPTHTPTRTPSPSPTFTVLASPMPIASRIIPTGIATATPTLTPTPTSSPTPTPRPMQSPIRPPIPQTTLPSTNQLTNPLTDSLPNTLNLILLGSDRRPGETIGRTDTIIVVMLDPQNKQAGVISIPRDLWVTIPNRGSNKINTAAVYGGLATVKQVVGNLLGIPIDYYVQVDFEGFQKAIDVLGGITVEIDCPLEEGYPDPTAPGGVRRDKFAVGKMQMNGQLALDFSRSRQSTSIFDRMRRQSRVLLGVREKALSPTVFPRVPELWDVMSKYVQTDVPARNVWPLVKLANEIKLSDVHGLAIDTNLSHQTYSTGGLWILVPEVSKIQVSVRGLFSATALTELVQKGKPCGG
jgi:LCP family protein required for cell wall assembly